MLVTRVETVPVGDIDDVLGIVRGNTVEALNVDRDVTQSLRNLVDGGLKPTPNC